MPCAMMIMYFNAVTLLLIQGGFSINNSKRNVPMVVASQGINSAYKPPTAQIVLPLSTRQQDYSVKEGSNVVIECKATGHPKPTITWILMGGTLYQRRLNLNNSTLYISNIKRAEQGRITCKAANAIGNPALSTQRVRVIYLDKPLISVGISGRDHNEKSIWYQNLVKFQCEIRSNSKARFVWKKDDMPILPSNNKGIILQNPHMDPFMGITITRLIIKNAKSGDVGRYDCLASLGQTGRIYNVNDTITSFNYRLDLAPPMIKIKGPSQVVVNKGERVRITCQVTGGMPHAWVSWQRDDGTVFASSKTRTILDLYIKQADYGDTATYFCIGNNGVGVSPQKSVKVYVRRLGSMTYWITPQRFNEAPDWRLVQGSYVRISCHTDADPDFELQYSWYKMTLQNKRESLNLERIPNFSITSNRDEEVKQGYSIPAMSSRLQIDRLSADDYGMYVCAATLRGFENYTEVNTSIALGRDSAPSKITAAKLKYAVVQGSDVMLQCDASAVPKPLIVFRREENMTMPSGNEEDVSKDGSLLLSNISRDDEGMYICEAARYNGFTRRATGQTQIALDVEVLFPPIVTRNYFDIRKPRDSELNLFCFLEDANPRYDLFYEWFKDGTSQGTAHNNNQFRVPSVDNTHYGVYLCKINNSVGSTQCVFNVSNTPYEPEFYYWDTPLTLSQSSDTYKYMLSWTQHHPEAVEPVIKYQIKWRPVGSDDWMKDKKMIPGGVRNGQLINFPISNLKTGFYEVEVTPSSRFADGDKSRMLIEAHSRILREVSPTTAFNLAGETYFCSFTDPKRCSFIQPSDNDSNFNWLLNSYKNQVKRTEGTGPEADYSNGVKEGPYMYIESSRSKKGDKARLVSPFFWHSSANQHCLKFYYHMKGRDIGRLRVLLSNRNGGETELWRREREQGKSWKNCLININQDSEYQIIFEATILQENGYRGDIAIDDVSLDPLQCVFPPTTTVSPWNSPLGGGSDSMMRGVMWSSKASIWTIACEQAHTTTLARTLLLSFIFQFLTIKICT